jgi:hypothetical protein
MFNYFGFKGFKMRSLPNTKTIGRYLLAYAGLWAVFLLYNFVNITLLSDGFPIVLPNILILCVPIIFIVVYYKIESETAEINKDDLYKTIALIQQRRSQALIEELAHRPEILKRKFKNKSLLYWAKYYDNREAHSIIIKQMYVK